MSARNRRLIVLGLSVLGSVFFGPQVGELVDVVAASVEHEISTPTPWGEYDDLLGVHHE